jgi:hypothetical protein
MSQFDMTQPRKTQPSSLLEEGEQVQEENLPPQNTQGTLQDSKIKLHNNKDDMVN